jgi:polyhydroxybutyrate depolymerase
MKSLLCALLCANIGVAQTTAHSFTFGGLTREYVVFLPHNYASLANIPVVLILHGYDSTPQDMIDWTGMNAIADTAGFIAVYPQAVGLRWNSGIGDDPGWPTPNVDDVGFFSALIDTLLANYKIDFRRVSVCGLSNGGFMSYKLACQLSSRFAAAASVSGAVANSTAASCAPVTAIPLLFIHGTADPLTPYNGNPYLLSVPQALQRWLAFNQCTGQPDTVFLPDIDTTDGCTVERISYNHCSGSSRMVFYKVNNGGHSWPGATVNSFYSGNLNMDINAGVEIWNFVKNFALTPVGIGREPESRIPVSFSLSQSYPNPFNPSTTIRYGIPHQTEVTLAIFNTLGQHVATLVQGEQDAGYHEVRFDGSNLASGVYFYRLQAGSYVETKKLMLLR